MTPWVVQGMIYLVALLKIILQLLANLKAIQKETKRMKKKDAKGWVQLLVQPVALKCSRLTLVGGS